MPAIPKTKTAIAVFAVAVGLSAIFHAYLLRTDAGGEVLWNEKEAYFFIFTVDRGYHVSWLRYPLEYGLARLGYVEPANDTGGSFFVVHVTAAGVERHVLDLPDHPGPSQFTPRGGRIWANWPTLGGLCWWAGDHFQLASQEEQRAFNGIAGLLADKAFDAGWHKDGVAAQGERSVAIDVGEEFELLVSGRRAPNGRGRLAAEMRYPGGEQIPVFDIEVRVGRVSKGEYLQAFRDPP